jgi:7-cyano-7-deazaguanine reductase
LAARGLGKNDPVPLEPSRDLIALPNPHPAREYEVRCDSSEFTCICPVTGQPDFATVNISYVPAASIVELKSLKQYLWSYRDEGAFHEDVTNRILDDLVAALAPRRMRVTTDWLVRGGIHTVVEANHEAATSSSALTPGGIPTE